MLQAVASKGSGSNLSSKRSNPSRILVLMLRVEVLESSSGAKVVGSPCTTSVNVPPLFGAGVCAIAERTEPREPRTIALVNRRIDARREMIISDLCDRAQSLRRRLFQLAKADNPSGRRLQG